MNLDGFSLRTLQNTKAVIMVAISKGIKTTEDLEYWLKNYVDKQELEHSRLQRRPREGQISDNGKSVTEHDRDRKRRIENTRTSIYQAEIVRSFPLCPDCGNQLYPEFSVDEIANDVVMILKCTKKCRYSRYEGGREEVRPKYPRFFELLDAIQERYRTSDI